MTPEQKAIQRLIDVGYPKKKAIDLIKKAKEAFEKANAVEFEDAFRLTMSPENIMAFKLAWEE